MGIKKNLVVLTGAGISAESGIATFRDAGGLWEGHDIMEVASPLGWAKNKELVLNFYNQRRKQAYNCEPNLGHLALKQLEAHFHVKIITQNVDNLHEKAGSVDILHLHGELFKSRSEGNPNLIYEMKDLEISLGDLCEDGHQLRPHIVWFGEAVEFFPEAVKIAEKADIMLVIGTSLAVYPANSLIEYCSTNCPLFLVDPKKPDLKIHSKVEYLLEPASTGLPKLAKRLIEEFV